MHTVPPPPGSDPEPLPGPKITPEFTELLEYWAAVRGLPPEPWAA
jgi:hypothetical protein